MKIDIFERKFWLKIYGGVVFLDEIFQRRILQMGWRSHTLCLVSDYPRKDWYLLLGCQRSPNNGGCHGPAKMIIGGEEGLFS